MPRPESRRRIAWTAGLLQGLLSGTASTIVITLGAPRIGRDPELDWMQIGTVLLRADSIRSDPEWWNIAAGVVVHQAADLSWALVFFALGRYFTWNLTAPVLLVLAMPWAAVTAAIEYYAILPSLQPIVVMQVPFWTALGVHVTSGLFYPLYPRVRAIVTRQPEQWNTFTRALAAGLVLLFAVLGGLELLARADREPAWPLLSAQERMYDATFLRHMAAHHAVGIELAATAAANTSSADLRNLARLMVANQAGEVAVIERWWRSWIGGPLPRLSDAEHAMIPGMPGPAMRGRLRVQRGHRFDADFVRLMIVHHQGAIQMADEAWELAADPRVRLMADSIRHAQSRQIRAMEAAGG